MEENNIRNNVYKKAGIIGAGKAGCSLGMFIKNKCGDVELPDKKMLGLTDRILPVNGLLWHPHHGSMERSGNSGQYRMPSGSA